MADTEGMTFGDKKPVDESPRTLIGVCIVIFALIVILVVFNPSCIPRWVLRWQQRRARARGEPPSDSCHGCDGYFCSFGATNTAHRRLLRPYSPSGSGGGAFPAQNGSLAAGWPPQQGGRWAPMNVLAMVLAALGYSSSQAVLRVQEEQHQHHQQQKEQQQQRGGCPAGVGGVAGAGGSESLADVEAGPGVAPAPQRMQQRPRAAAAAQAQAPLDSCESSFFAFEVLDARHLVTGLLGPWAVLAVRLLQLAAFVFALVFQAHGPTDFATGELNAYWLTYFTNWVFIGFAAQALVGTALSLLALWSGRLAQPDPSQPALCGDGMDKGVVWAGNDAFVQPGDPLVVPAPGEGGRGKHERAMREALAAASSGEQQHGAAGTPAAAAVAAAAVAESSEAAGGSEALAAGKGGDGNPGAVPVQLLLHQDARSAWRYTPLDMLHLMLYTAFFASSVVTTVFYWAATGGSDKRVKVDSVVRHGGHAFLMILDLVVSRIPVTWPHVLLPVALHGAYAVFLFAFSIVKWVYSPLDFNYFLSPLFYFLIAVVLFIAHGFMYLVAWLREKLVARQEEEQ